MSTKALKAGLYRLIDVLPEDEIKPVQRFLEFLISQKRDPLLQALLNAPDDDEEETEDEREAVKEAEADIKAGRTGDWKELNKRLQGKS